MTTRAGVVPLPILTYHSLDASGSVISVTPAEFAAHLGCIAGNGRRGMSLREAVAHRDIHGSWPADGVVLTFDDGYANCHEIALPALQRFGFTATVLVVTAHVDGRNDWAPPPPGFGTHPMLAWQQIHELVASGIEIGSHTRSHPDLRTLTAVEAAVELTRSRHELEDRLGVLVESFAYPFGHRAWPDLVAREFHSACTTELRQATTEPTHDLPRIDMYYVRAAPRLAQLLSGRLNRWLMLRRWARALRAAVVE